MREFRGRQEGPGNPTKTILAIRRVSLVPLGAVLSGSGDRLYSFRNITSEHWTDGMRYVSAMHDSHTLGICEMWSTSAWMLLRVQNKWLALKEDRNKKNVSGIV